MQIIIRIATEQDFPQVLRLIKEFSQFQGAPDKVTITAEQMEEDKDLFRCFVAEAAGGEVVGFASFFPAYYSWTGKAIYLDDLYVAQAFRKQGTGKKLLQAVINLAREEGCKKVRWQVSKWNTNAIDFYQSMGASIDEVEINCDMPLQAAREL
jgi:GNAT superfamily N-acetyltransferase